MSIDVGALIDPGFSFTPPTANKCYVRSRLQPHVALVGHMQLHASRCTWNTTACNHLQPCVAHCSEKGPASSSSQVQGCFVAGFGRVKVFRKRSSVFMPANTYLNESSDAPKQTASQMAPFWCQFNCILSCCCKDNWRAFVSLGLVFNHSFMFCLSARALVKDNHMMQPEGKLCDMGHASEPHCSWQVFWVFVSLALFILSRGLQTTRLFATIPRVVKF